MSESESHHTWEASAAAQTSSEALAALFPTPRQLFILLACYFALQVGSRVCFSSSVDLDEAEAVVLAQQFSPGYSAAPPLYTWLQIVFFKVFGQNVFSLSLLKNVLLLSIYYLTFAAARLVTRSTPAAVAVCLSLLFLPNIAWESQRDLTHSVLASVFSVATLVIFLKLQESRRLLWYSLFGLCAGCGLLSKYNYALWFSGLLFAGLSLPQLRVSILHGHMLLALAIMTAIFAPFGLWALEHRELATLSSNKFEFQTALGWPAAAWLGLKNIAQSILSYCGALAAIYFLLFFKATKRTDAAGFKMYQALMARTWVLILLGLFVWIVLTRATGLKERWFQPIFVTMPIFAASLIQTRLSPGRMKLLTAMALTVMAAVLIVMPGRLFAAERLGREEPLTRPYAELAAQVRPVIAPGSFVVCDTRILAGNLRLNLHDVKVLDTRMPRPPGLRSCCLAWDARGQDGLPESLRQYIGNPPAGDLASLSPRYFKAVYRYHRSKEFRLGLLQLP